MNKSVAGYKMLMILANVDGTHLRIEQDLVESYLGDSLPEAIPGSQIEAEQNRIVQLSQEEQMLEFRAAMNAYYSESTSAERSQFLQYAMDLIKSDEHISPEENIFINKLFDAWGETE
jgi:uncharacterized tellurite resistance protein B-like protein